MAGRTAAKTRKQSAATPKPPAAKPRPQRAAVPKPGARPRRSAPASRQTPPIPAEFVEHFGGQDHLDLIIAEHVPPDASAGDVLRLLLEARRLGADLLRGDVYLARGMSRDGSGVGYSVAARRDTLLAYAKRQPGFLGHDEAAIFAEDTFKRGKPDASAATLAERVGIVHETGMPGKRGAIVGAWAVAAMRDDDPVVRILDAVDYVGTPEERAVLDPDDPKRQHPDLCMIAAAMSNALRIASGLNDVVGAEELTQRAAPLPDLGERVAPPIFEEGPVDELDARIMDAYRQAQALDPSLWPPAKVTARLASARATRNAEIREGDDIAVEDPQAAYDERRTRLAEEIESDVQDTIARRRDPQQIARRLKELRAFDPEDLDAEARREYDTERAAVEAAAAAAGIDVAA